MWLRVVKFCSVLIRFDGFLLFALRFCGGSRVRGWWVWWGRSCTLRGRLVVVCVGLTVRGCGGVCGVGCGCLFLFGWLWTVAGRGVWCWGGVGRAWWWVCTLHRRRGKSLVLGLKLGGAWLQSFFQCVFGRIQLVIACLVGLCWCVGWWGGLVRSGVIEIPLSCAM